jgi:Zn-dependent protease with chaperone function
VLAGAVALTGNPAALACHPSLKARIARLERLESHLQTFRP